MSLRKVYLILGSGLGLSVATISLYWLYRKLEDTNFFGILLDSSPTFKIPSKMPSHYIRVPTYLVPQLIGTNGDNIKELEARTQTRIFFETEVLYNKDVDQSNGDNESKKSDDCDSTDNDWCEDRHQSVAKNSRLTGYRYMSIRGSDQNVKQLQEIIEKLIAENAIESITIPDGCNIVGFGGQIINDIQDQSGAKVKVDGNRYTHNRSVMIIGNERQRGCAEQMINKIIDEFNDSNVETIE